MVAMSFKKKGVHSTHSVLVNFTGLNSFSIVVSKKENLGANCTQLRKYNTSPDQTTYAE